jgi:choline dehydrogenase-like flavoprotein/nucleoside-diphosphate-sugar epimerase
MTKQENLQTLTAGSEISADLCIVGSGPAGLAIARAFAMFGVRVLVLESGGLEEDARVDALGAIESDGYARELDQTRVRNRIFGGSTQTWKGRCTAFAAIDFAVRDWIPNSGWPIRSSDVEEYLHQAADFLALGPNVYDEKVFDLLGIRPPAPDLDRRTLDTFFWQFSKNLEFPYGGAPYGPLQVGREFLRAQPENVRILVNATVTHLNTNREGTRLLSLDVSSIEGTRVTVVPRATVLCAGAIENARLLLSSNRTQPGGIGNVHDNVGRYLMDHLRVEVGDFAPADAGAVQDRFEFYRVKGTFGYRAYLPGVVLSQEIQRKEKLLHCASWVELRGTAEDDPWPAARALLRRKNVQRLRDLKAALGQPRFVGRGLYRSLVGRRGFRHKGDKLALVCMCEQIPNRESRVVLSSHRDALGVPMSRVHWKVDDRELETLVRTAELVARAFDGAKLPSVRLFDWVRQRQFERSPAIDVAHPTGTTRMSVDPRDGVVNRDCKVHGVEGLYVAGSSVFPTAGHANPTLMIVALALRLADHLKATLFAGAPLRAKAEPPALFVPPRVSLSAAATPRVLVTGGTGKIGRALVAELVRRGYRIRLVTSQQHLALPGVDVRSMNWLHTLDFAPFVEGCDAVLHLGAELHEEAKMQRVNVEATAALAAAAEASGVRFFGYASTVSVYGSPRSRVLTEQSPVVDDPGVKYFAVPYLKAYAATKLAGERRIREVARKISYAVYRPTVVVDVDVLGSMRKWSRADRVRYGGRLTNHVYLGDVVQAMIWLMERKLVESNRAGANIDVFNLSDESAELSTYDKLYGAAYRLTGDARFRSFVSVPPAYDMVRDIMRYRGDAIPMRYPLGLLRFPPEKLLNAGFQHPYGLDAFYRRALERLSDCR